MVRHLGQRPTKDSDGRHVVASLEAQASMQVVQPSVIARRVEQRSKFGLGRIEIARGQRRVCSLQCLLEIVTGHRHASSPFRGVSVRRNRADGQASVARMRAAPRARRDLGASGSRLRPRLQKRPRGQPDRRGCDRSGRGAERLIMEPECANWALFWRRAASTGGPRRALVLIARTYPIRHCPTRSIRTCSTGQAVSLSLWSNRRADWGFGLHRICAKTADPCGHRAS